MEKQNLIFWELNEVNFTLLKKYAASGQLPTWSKFLEKHQLIETTSENKYELLEPWIQWPSIRTGKKFSDHQVFRLGDFASTNHQQHWEIIESNGFSTAAISPINAKNNCTRANFWIPDPWTPTPVSGRPFLKRIAHMLKQTVGDNASGKVSASSFLTLILAIASTASLSNLRSYLYYLCISFKYKWARAILFELLLTELFFKLQKKYSPNFSTLFSNVGAHFQHHYFFNSKFYEGKQTNPTWYIKEKQDPILAIYKLYDKVLDKILRLKKSHVIIATGLSQIPTKSPVFYWRLNNHSNFLKELKINVAAVLPNMSRDFTIKFKSKEEAKSAEETLLSLTVAPNNTQLFTVDNRGISLFVTLSYSHDIAEGTPVLQSGQTILHDLKQKVIFVALKNGHHSSKGWFLSSYNKPEKSSIPISDIYTQVLTYFNCHK